MTIERLGLVLAAAALIASPAFAQGKGDNRDDAKSGKVDRKGDGNSGQGDDLHRKARPSDKDRDPRPEKARDHDHDKKPGDCCKCRKPDEKRLRERRQEHLKRAPEHRDDRKDKTRDSSPNKPQRPQPDRGRGCGGPDKKPVLHAPSNPCRGTPNRGPHPK